jgi:hypothetical protein
MTRIITLVAALLVAGTVAFAHGGYDHVRGTVTKIAGQSLTVQTPDKSEKTLTLTDKTTFKQGGKSVGLSALQVGDRVVVDVPEKTTTAFMIQIGAASKTDAQK